MASPPAAADEAREPRAKYSRSQLDRLEDVFRHQQFIDPQQTLQLSCELGISVKQTRTWFQNKRAMLRRRAIKVAGSSYVPNLQLPAGLPKTHPTPPVSPRYNRRSASPAAVPPATTVVCPGLQVRSQTLAGTETQPQQSLPSLGSFPAGPDFLTVPQLRWDGRVSPTTPSSPSPAMSSGDEEFLSASLELRPNVAAPANRQFGSFDSLWPSRQPPPPPLTSSLSHSAPCVSLGGSQPGLDYVQYRQTPSSISSPASMWQGQPQGQHVQVPRRPVSDVQQRDWWSPSLQTNDAGANSAGNSELVPSIGSLTSLVLELEAAAIEGGGDSGPGTG